MQEILDYVINSGQYSSPENLASAVALAGVATIQGAQYASNYLSDDETETKDPNIELDEDILEEDPENITDQSSSDLLEK